MKVRTYIPRYINNACNVGMFGATLVMGIGGILPIAGGAVLALTSYAIKKYSTNYFSALSPGLEECCDQLATHQIEGFVELRGAFRQMFQNLRRPAIGAAAVEEERPEGMPEVAFVAPVLVTGVIQLGFQRDVDLQPFVNDPTMLENIRALTVQYNRLLQKSPEKTDLILEGMASELAEVTSKIFMNKKFEKALERQNATCLTRTVNRLMISN